MKVAGRRTVVTGGASGIGRALCRRFAADGAAQVVVVDRDEAGARAVAEEIGGRALTVDVSHEAEVTRMVRDAEAEGPIDLLVSNAGIGIGGGPEVPDEQWDRIWRINVMSQVWAARAALPAMLERGQGYLLNTASAAGLLSQIGSAPYAVTKHAAVGLAEWLAITYGQRGIKVSVLCPQAVRTAMTANSENGGVAGVDGMIEPEDVAQSVVDALAEERFLVLPHPTVETYMQRKVSDYDRWIGGMQRLQARFADAFPEQDS